MSSTTARARSALENLYEIISQMKDGVPCDGHIDLGDLENVQHIIGFDFEHLNTDSISKMFPPFHFDPMKPALLKSFPLDAGQRRDFMNITQLNGTLDFAQKHFPPEIPMSPSDRCQQISSLISDYATYEAISHQKLQNVGPPDSTLHYEEYEIGRYNGNNLWHVSRVMEPEPQTEKTYPHLVLHLIHTKVAQENTIQFAEFSALVLAMRARANQRKVDSEDELEQLYETNGEGIEEYPYLFPNEEEFPVLLISCVLPQHARILAASMYQRTLVIRQSKLYSFEYRKDAPVELFTRLFLSRPYEVPKKAA
ncbi:hypothetical protein AbraIFM66951_010803 [Aspergillus brasiliensis]|uniref:Uncharacterized protein n=1 Tax=Aspergillus brasiliensis TaxID=319629 RepID=A0A9W5YKZ3_9EURO|nr:hypothetical protein AbraCBS73388_004768 [Aspergillus brasiliensis]GKZ47437.1 hypothetical protein AbraIFM66951_010803 [Aspergillus brasiliensis]